MKVEQRIPTILGVLIITVSLGATVFLANNIRTYLSRASPDVTPLEVKITNISDNSFTISWVTDGNVSGAVSFGENSSLGSLATDDRDQVSGKTGEYRTHHLTLKSLKPGAKYYLKIISGGKTFDNNGNPFIVTTAPTVTTTPPVVNPVYGTVQTADGLPAEGVIVYLNLAEATPLSTLVKTSGNYLFTLNNARTADLADFAKLSGSKKIEIFVQGGSKGTAQAAATIGNNLPIPQITLGGNYDFTQEVVPMASPTATPSPSPVGGFGPPQVATPSPSLISPTSGVAIPSDRPVFAGTGIPGKTVTIKIESPAPVTGTTKVDQNGNWTWTPPSSLSPGDHTVTVTTTDSSNKLVKFTRNFTILASGTQVTEPATPSATVKPSPTATPSPTPSPSPTPKPLPTIRPSPTATPSTAPASGNLTPTVLILLSGLGLLVLGIGRLFLLDKP